MAEKYNQKRILKNTLILYLRMIFLLALSLYTSRLFLEVLGIEDYGIYTLVGGVMVMFSFISSALTSATSRLINYTLGKGDESELSDMFSSALSVHLLICVVLAILGETLGLWFLNYELNIPAGKENAANWVYQLSILATFFGVMGTPFEGAIIANEKMNVYAWISIIEALIKLTILFILFKVGSNRLIWYATLFFIANTIVMLIKWIYSASKFKYVRFRLAFKRKYVRSIAYFSGWSIFGQIAYIGSTTGVNMAVNIYWGVVLNAAIGIATQVNDSIYKFVSNFQVAFNPQLIQTYSAGELEQHRELITKASKVSFFLVYIIALPLLFNIDYVLHLWLVEVPPYTAPITILIVLFSIIEATGAPIWMSMQAIGKIKTYQICVSSINMLTLPLAILFLALGLSPVSVFVAKLIIGVALYIFRFAYVLPKVSFRLTTYYRQILGPIIVCVLSSSTALFGISLTPLHGFAKLAVDILCSTSILLIMAWTVGMNHNERQYIRIQIDRMLAAISKKPGVWKAES